MKQLQELINKWESEINNSSIAESIYRKFIDDVKSMHIYYKGFSYQKDENGDEFWYDENNFCRKEIIYHDNNKKGTEIYYNEKEERHNEDGYAVQSWDKDGTPMKKEYWLNGIHLTEEEWKLQVNNIESVEVKEVIYEQPEWMNPESDKYYKGFRYKKSVNTGSEWWYDENDTLRKYIGYHENGNKQNEAYWDEIDEVHNEDGFAVQEWYENGNLKRQLYYLNGIELTEDEWKQQLINKTNNNGRS